MRAERYLTTIREDDCRIGELVRLQTVMSGAASPSERVLKDRQHLETQITKVYKENHAARKRAQRLIDKLPDPAERQVLTMFYLQKLTVGETAEVMGFSPRHLYRVKQRALMHLEGLFL